MRKVKFLSILFLAILFVIACNNEDTTNDNNGNVFIVQELLNDDVNN